MNRNGVLRFLGFFIPLTRGNTSVIMIRTMPGTALLTWACLLAPAIVHAAITQQERAALLDFYNGNCRRRRLHHGVHSAELRVVR